MMRLFLIGAMKACGAAVLGWLPAAFMLLLLSGCVKWEKDPLAAYSIDPKSFNFYVVAF